jgi:aryl-alcohol dehydrogenase-like predicted oxidoreductase
VGLGCWAIGGPFSNGGAPGRSERTVPIPGFRTVAQVEDNLTALKHGPLTAEQLREIEALLR